MSGSLRPIAVAVLVAVASSSCATTNLWRWSGMTAEGATIGTGNVSPEEFPEAFGRALVAIVAMLPAVAWDVVTFPVQYLGGYHPYGPRWSPSGRREPPVDR